MEAQHFGLFTVTYFIVEDARAAATRRMFAQALVALRAGLRLFQLLLVEALVDAITDSEAWPLNKEDLQMKPHHSHKKARLGA